MKPADLFEFAARKIEEELARIKHQLPEGVTEERWLAVPDTLIGGWAVATQEQAEKEHYFANFVHTPVAFYMAMMGPLTGQAMADMFKVVAKEVRAVEGTEWAMHEDGTAEPEFWEKAFALAKLIAGV